MKTFFQMLLMTTGILFTLSLQQAQAAELLKVTPGKSLGSVSLGESRSKLLDLGFGPDGATDPQTYLQYNGVLVRLENDKVAQIYADTKTLKRLRFHNKKLPKDTSTKSLKKFFQNCGRQIRTSEGLLVYCEHHGIELTYGTKKGQLQGLAIVTGKAGKASKSARAKKSDFRALPKKIVKKPKTAAPPPPEKAEATGENLEPKPTPKEEKPADNPPPTTMPPTEDEQSLEKEVESMPSQPETAPPPAVAPADSPAPTDGATPDGKASEKPNDLPYED